MPDTNAKVASVFREIAERLEIEGAAPVRIRDYRNAARMLESLGHDVRPLVDQPGALGALPGIGTDLAATIVEVVQTGGCALLERRHKDQRYRRDAVEPVATALLDALGALPGVHKALAVGSLRRGSETVGDIDLLVTADQPATVMDRLAGGEDVQQVLVKGVTRCSLVHRTGVHVDVRAVAPVSFGSAALYFTGSKAHNVALRQLAQARGLRLNEYGLYRGRQRIAGDTEESVYAALGLASVAPELREDRGELRAAASGALPALVQLSDLQGDLHAHTLDSDGADGLEAMAAAAQNLGLHYLAITDHGRRRCSGPGLDEDALLRQIDRIDAINAGRADFLLLKGVEVDILEDGSLDLADGVLRRLDLVVASVHGGYDLSREKQTGRLLRAMDSPYFSLLAHPCGRIVNERPACDIDLARVIRKARERACFLELDAQPARLDLSDTACRMAKSEGVLVSINSDAHSRQQLGFLRYGIGQARRGWLEAGDVLNTRTPDQLRTLLKATMAG